MVPNLQSHANKRRCPFDITLETIFSMPGLDLANGNARHARRGFEEATVRQANRLVGTDPDREALMTLTAEDLGVPPSEPADEPADEDESPS